MRMCGYEVPKFTPAKSTKSIKMTKHKYNLMHAVTVYKLLRWIYFKLYIVSMITLFQQENGWSTSFKSEFVLGKCNKYEACEQYIYQMGIECNAS